MRATSPATETFFALKGGAMFQFLFGVAFGAAGYWAWQSFGRDLMGMGSDQDTTYGGFNSSTSGAGSTSSYGTGSSSTPSTSGTSGGNPPAAT
jgi:hypothetical protein